MNQITAAKLYTYGSFQDIADMLDLEKDARSLHDR